jgi:hypothetical protein
MSVSALEGLHWGADHTVPVISPHELAELCKICKTIEIIDVRIPMEYREVHVEAAQRPPTRPCAHAR